MLLPKPPRLLTRQEVPIQTYRAGSSMLGNVLPWVAIAYGVTMPIGGNERWEGHSLEPLMFFSGAATTYGTLLLILGMLMAIGQITDIPGMIFIGGWGCGFWFIVAAVSTLVQGFGDTDPVFFAGAGSWGFLAINCIIYASARVDHRPKPVEEPPSSQKS